MTSASPSPAPRQRKPRPNLSLQLNARFDESVRSTDTLDEEQDIVDSPDSFTGPSIADTTLNNSQTTNRPEDIFSRNATLVGSPPPMSAERPSTSTAVTPADPFEGWDIRPTLPIHSTRYDPFITETKPLTVSIPAGPLVREGILRLDGSGGVPSGWKEYIHPGEGVPYFYHTTLKIVTTAQLRHTRIQAIVLECYNQIEGIRAQQPIASALAGIRYETCLEIDEDEKKCGYYCVFHDRSDPHVFWWHKALPWEFDPAGTSSTLQALALQRQFQYWLHRQYFPLPDDSISYHETTVRAILSMWSVDHRTSTGSTAAFRSSECDRFLNSLHDLPKDDTNDSAVTARVWCVSRILGSIEQSRLANRFGQPDARVDRLQNITIVHKEPSNWYKFLDWISFIIFLGAHKPHLKRLEQFWCEKVAYSERWQSFLQDLVTDCNDTNLLAAVLLGAAIGFLQLPNVDESTIVRSSCIMSGMFSLSSLTLGLHHVWKHREKQTSGAEVASDYMQASEHPHYDYLPLSILLCLPLALLLWSIVSFAVAIVFFAFLDRSTVTQWLGISATTATAVGMTLSVCITLHFFWGVWERREPNQGVGMLLASALDVARAATWGKGKELASRMGTLSLDMEAAQPRPNATGASPAGDKPVKRFTL